MAAVAGTAPLRAAEKTQQSGEAPAGMEAEAKLLEQLTSIPQISKATARPARGSGGGVQVLVRSATLCVSRRRGNKRMRAGSALFAAADHLIQQIRNLPTHQVQSAQHNLPANSKRQLLHTVHVPDAAAPDAAFVSGVPVELPAMELQSVSPSGARAAASHACACARLWHVDCISGADHKLAQQLHATSMHNHLHANHARSPHAGGQAP